MSRKRFTLSKDEEKALEAAYSVCQDGQTKTRYQAVRLYGNGYAVQEIAEITGCSRPSLMEWCRSYRQGGIAGLLDKRRGGNRAKLTAAQVEEVQRHLHRYTPAQLFGAAQCHGDGSFWTIADLAHYLGQRYGVRYQSQTSYRALLARCGFSLQRPGGPYYSHHEGQVMAFEEALEKNC
jgi:transposase